MHKYTYKLLKPLSYHIQKEKMKETNGLVFHEHICCDSVRDVDRAIEICLMVAITDLWSLIVIAILCVYDCKGVRLWRQSERLPQGIFLGGLTNLGQCDLIEQISGTVGSVCRPHRWVDQNRRFSTSKKWINT